MARNIAIGIQDFGDLIQKNCFYIDKTDFLREWWESNDSVTLITRPRRFGKTLNMSMTEQFFSLKYAGKGELFEGLSIWKHEKYRKLQGTYPVISLSFANVKETCYQDARKKIFMILTELYSEYSFLSDSDALDDNDRAFFRRISVNMDHIDAAMAIHYLSKFLFLHYGKKVIILLDEYDTPMQEAYVHGFWEDFVTFTKNLFHATFKTNPWLNRGIMTGITRISKESIFSDLNNLKAVSATSKEYAASFGFTEEEVFAALKEQGLDAEKEQVTTWYDGFIFGDQQDIYNPWSILNFLDTQKFDTYWANTSSNTLVSKLIREGSPEIKTSFEKLLQGECFTCAIDEQIVYDQLDNDENAIWSLLLASGYLKVTGLENANETNQYEKPLYHLKLTNYEVARMFRSMVRGWFASVQSYYNNFIQALLKGDTEAMNGYMNRVALHTFSFFDTGRNISDSEPERFYHGFVLGLIIDLHERYEVTSNRESGFGRYDVLLMPRAVSEDDAIILEFKVLNPSKENSLEDTAKSALQQIEEKNYSASLIQKGIPENHIRKYGFAFQGKQVLIL